MLSFLPARSCGVGRRSRTRAVARLARGPRRSESPDLEEELAKLGCIRQLALPAGLFDFLSPKIRNAYRSHYRRMLTRLLTTLTFQATNDRHKSLLEGLALVQKHAGNRSKTYPAEESVPLEGVAQEHWENVVFEKDSQGQLRVNRISYELCVLKALRERLRCKEIWVGGASRYRNPDEDLPQDFATARNQYYAALRLPQEAKLLLREIRQEMEEGLARWIAACPRTKECRFCPKEKGGSRYRLFRRKPNHRTCGR